MSLEYLEEAIFQALEQSSGNQKNAQHLIMSQAMNDLKLLQALTRHHLSGIVAYHVDRVASGRANKTKRAYSDTGRRSGRGQQEQAAPEIDEQFGLQLLKALAGSSSDATFGMEAYSSPQPKGKASSRHADTIRALANKRPPNG